MAAVRLNFVRRSHYSGGNSPLRYRSWRVNNGEKGLFGVQFTRTHILQNRYENRFRFWAGPKALSFSWSVSW